MPSFVSSIDLNYLQRCKFWVRNYICFLVRSSLVILGENPFILMLELYEFILDNCEFIEIVLSFPFESLKSMEARLLCLWKKLLILHLAFYFFGLKVPLSLSREELFMYSSQLMVLAVCFLESTCLFLNSMLQIVVLLSWFWYLFIIRLRTQGSRALERLLVFLLRLRMRQWRGVQMAGRAGSGMELSGSKFDFLQICKTLGVAFILLFLRGSRIIIQDCPIMILKYLKRKWLTILNRYISWIVIVVFQFLGTLIFAYCTYNLVNLKATYNDIYSKIVFYFVDFSLSMLMCISYARQFSGGLLNPAVAFFRIFRKTERYPVKTAIVYMLCQIAGAMCGCFLALGVNNVNHAPITSILPWQIQLKHIATDALGTMILTFMVQLASEKKMTFIEHNRQFYIILPLYYLIARTYSSKSNGVNPAFGLGFQVVYCYHTGQWNIFYQTYIFFVGPFLGAFIACMAFEYGMRPMFPLKKEVVIETNLWKMKRKKSEIELKPADAPTTKNKWTLSEVMNEQKYAPIGDQYEFVAIAEDEIDEEIESDQQNLEQENLPLQTDLERQLKNTNIISNQYESKVVTNSLFRRSRYRKNVREGQKMIEGDIRSSREGPSEPVNERKRSNFQGNLSVFESPNYNRIQQIDENDGL